MKKVFVSDVTLRTFKEESNKSLSFREKLNLAINLEKTGVDGIELPYVVNEKEDVVIYRTIAQTVKKAKICIPCGFSDDEIATAYECVRANENARLQIIVPVSTVQMEYSFHMKASKMLDKITALVGKASSLCPDVEVVLKDASRAESGFVRAVCQSAEKAGAKAVTLCDDGGVYFPNEFAGLVCEVKESTALCVYVQPSDALKMAMCTAVECIKAGADGVKCSSNGKLHLILSDFADVIRAKGDDLGISTSLDFTSIHNIVGKINENNEEPVTNNSNKDIPFDENTPLSSVANVIKELGYDLSDEDTSKVFDEVKRVFIKKNSFNTRELEAVIATTAMQVPSTYHLVSYVVNSGNIMTATASIVLEKAGEKISGVSTGDGPIDASFHAIEQIIGHHYELDDFQVQAVTKGREAVGSSLIKLRANGKIYSGNGVSTDVVGACVRAYVNALNKIVYEAN